MEVRKIKSTERATEEREHEDDTINTVLFTAGAALLMACLKRAMIMCLVEQWRAWVFLVLNLVLLAIFFTSIRSGADSNESQECNVDDVGLKKTERKTNRRQCASSAAAAQVEEHKDCHKMYKKRSVGNDEQPAERVEDDVVAEANPIRLSKEELNKRAETFIAMFRQHLVTDAEKGRRQFFYEPEGAKILNFQQGSNVTFSPRGVVKC
jgi:type III secretory pathway component EscV